MIDGADAPRIAEEALGPSTVVADLSWPHGESTVLELLTAAGRSVVAKAHRQAAKFEAELTAYERWVPALGPSAPSVVAADRAAQVLVLTKLDGRPFGPVAVGADAVDAVDDAGFGVDAVDVHRQAGRLLARFQRAGPPHQMPGYAEGRRARLDSWLDRARPDVLDTAEVELVRSMLEATAILPAPAGVPCHRDWQPRNWLVDAAGRVSVIDFEHARIGPWFEDLTRLWWNEWLQAPDLADAFFDGYGRRLDAVELQQFMAASALAHLVTIVWADEHSDPEYAARARASLDLIRTTRPSS